VASSPSPTKSELLKTLRDQHDEIVTAIRSLPADEFETGRYESGWNRRQILAHIASMEWTYARLVDIAREGGVAEGTRDNSSSGNARDARTPSRAMRGGNDAYNARQIAKRESATIGELIEEFASNRSVTIAALEAADDVVLRTTIRSAGGTKGPLTSVILLVAIAHVEQHFRDITNGAWFNKMSEREPNG
jgi:uncharacterized damage-inducible protein DinB